jgi:hypothetical protein
MPKKLVLSLLLVILGLGFWQTTAAAVIYRLRAQLNTMQSATTPPNPPNRYFSVNIIVGDSVQRAYDAVQTLTLTAPGAPAQDLTGFWDEGAQAYGSLFPLGTTGTMPAGNYKVIVVGNDSSTLTQIVKLDGTFLDPPTITAPLPMATVANLTPIIKWSTVAGAQYYSLNISGPGANFTQQMYRTNFTVPAGVLRPASTYTISLRAFNSDKDLTKSSNALGVTFKTP